ncbi:unnamed protein product [Paramecium sonneborni]|uniref:Uncharacterized protein n=1 Tax=Paramecium sonneborni TaxID=65129 RepID=A0A8S1RNS8_9CILI|nr:unnamed protein product [Paramecium sonneborni]
MPKNRQEQKTLVTKSFLMIKQFQYHKQKQLLIIKSISCSLQMTTQIRILRVFHSAQEHPDLYLKNNTFQITKKLKSPPISQKIFLHPKPKQHNRKAEESLEKSVQRCKKLKFIEQVLPNEEE